ncbi:amino acid ABC transporter substrate-binding protein [Aerococcus agrisoli]|uniref:Amino acid ABC transporter substrate-binding protein n=1 Tax=Aerococcus agrisoli TaxID=2487350 RepID=A0A3N4GX84_9LACT|nr:transporter substrate-binding domain-containing protein [Aerococcus agrisoli]RPA57594.1 amino acid ABC transporter substrate-binding protein [Aerococcus agrisoli]
MKKFKALGLGILSALVLAACGSTSSSEASGDSAEGDKVIVVAASPDGYPQHYMEDDELKGYSVEVIEAVAAEAGYTLEWELSDWSGVVANLQAGKADTAVNFANTPERRESYTYTENYFYAHTGIVVASDDTTTNTLEDLKGESVTGVVGSNYAEVLKEYNPDDAITIDFVETNAVAMANIQSGKTKGFVNGYEELAAQIKNRGLDARLIEEQFGEKPVGFPFKDTEENQQIIADFNAAIESLSADGTLAEISDKYFGVDVTKSTENAE